VKIKPIMRVIEKMGACRDDILDIVEDTVTFTHLVWITSLFEFDLMIDDPQENSTMMSIVVQRTRSTL
jgi:hypothetical protein